LFSLRKPEGSVINPLFAKNRFSKSSAITPDFPVDNAKTPTLPVFAFSVYRKFL
jgi:hypothetical protein